jgi:uncharacterized protein YaiI (UPF0178 family)
VITADNPVADRRRRGDCAKRMGIHKGIIGLALAMRDLMTDLRSAGEATRDPPFSPRDRSAFLSALHQAIRRLARRS